MGCNQSNLAIGGVGALFLSGNTSSLSANTTPTGKLYLCPQTLAVMVKTMGVYKWTALNPIKPQRGWGLYFQKWKYFLPFYQHHTHRQTLAVIVKKWECINGLHLTLLAIKGGFIFRNGNTFGLSASTTLTHKLYFCSQTLAVMVTKMRMYKWAPLNPVQSQRGGFIFRNKYLQLFCQHHTHMQILFLFSNIGSGGKNNGNV